MAASELYTTSLKTDANLQGYWRMEDNVVDSGPNGYNLTANNTPGYATGKFGKGIDLELGSSQSASIADASCANLEISGSQTWGCWIKPESLPGTMVAMGKCPNDAAAYALLSVVDASGHIQWYLGGVEDITSDEVVSSGVWSFIVGRYDSAGGLFDIFVNNVKKTDSSVQGPTHTDTNGAFAIGKLGTYSTQYYFDGIVDDAFIFNRALTDTEISQLYNGWPTSGAASFAQYLDV